MDLKEKLERQRQLAVRDSVNLLSRGETPDPATLALAVACGETLQSLADQAQAKIDKRTNPEAEKTEPVPVEAAVVTEEVPHEKVRSHHKK